MPDNDHNPYEAILEHPADLANRPLRLTYLEYAAAFFATIVLSVVTLFVSCAGMFTVGTYMDRVLATRRDNIVLLAFVLFLWVGIPILVTAFVGSYTLRTLVKALRPNAPPTSARSSRDSSETEVIEHIRE